MTEPGSIHDERINRLDFSVLEEASCPVMRYSDSVPLLALACC
jgi:hypothetical protein